MEKSIGVGMFDKPDVQKYCIKIRFNNDDGDEDETIITGKEKAKATFDSAVNKWDSGGVVVVIGDDTATAIHSKDVFAIYMTEEE